MFQLELRPTYDEIRRLAIPRAADRDPDALCFLLRDFIGAVKQGRALNPEVAHVVIDVFERVLAGESVGKILGTQAKRGRPRTYKRAILIHARVQHSMLLRNLQPRRTQRRGDDPQAEVAADLDMSPHTVRDNYRRVSKLTKTIIDESPFISLERRGLSPTEAVYVTLYITYGAKILANRGKRDFSLIGPAWYKNFLENIIEAIRTPDLTQAPTNGGWQWQFVTVCVRSQTSKIQQAARRLR